MKAAARTTHHHLPPPTTIHHRPPPPTTHHRPPPTHLNPPRARSPTGSLTAMSCRPSHIASQPSFSKWPSAIMCQGSTHRSLYKSNEHQIRPSHLCTW